MASSHLPVAGDHHQIECHGERSYWVVRYPDGPELTGRLLGRVVFFAHSEGEAKAYIRHYRHHH